MQIGKADDNSMLALPAEVFGRGIYVIGSSFAGKNELLENVALHLIEEGYCVVYLDRYGHSVYQVADRLPESITREAILWEPARFPIGFNPLFIKDNSETNTDRTVRRVMRALLHAWEPTKKQESFYDETRHTLLRNALRLLIDNGQTLKDMVSVLVDDRYRARLVKSSPTTRAYWEDVYGGWSDKQRTEYLAGLLNKLDDLLSNAAMRAMLGTHTPELDDVMRKRKAVLVNLSVAELGDPASALAGALITSTLFGFALEGEEQAPAVALIMPECAPFISLALPELFPEASRRGLFTVLGSEYEGQLPPQTIDALLANSATVISFTQTGDARRTAARLDMPEPNELRRLFDGSARVHTKRMERRGTLTYTVPYRTEIKTLPSRRTMGRVTPLRNWTRATYGGRRGP
jgi:hypothetical protein